MYRERLVECADCGDRFKITYDSRNETQKEYACKCGKLICHPDHWGSFSYNRDGRYKGMPYKEQEHKHKYYEEDYIRLTEEEQNLLSEIDEVGVSFGKDYLSPYSNKSDENGIRLELDGCSKSNEGLTISLEVRLRSYGNPWCKTEVEEKHERILSGLHRFKNVILKVKSGDINLDNPRKLWVDESLEWTGGTKTQQEIYDYVLCC